MNVSSLQSVFKSVLHRLKIAIFHFPRVIFAKFPNSIWRKNFEMGENRWNYHTHCHSAVWKLREHRGQLWKFWQIFREINVFTKELIWRNIFSMRVTFAFFHTVGNSLSRIFGKNFVKVTVLLKKLLNKWFDEIF